MEQFIWRDLGTVKVPDPEKTAWTPALDGITPRRLYRLKVKNPQAKWKVGGTVDCTADGEDWPAQQAPQIVCPGSPRGALIAKIGGSTADKTGTILAVGRYCVFQLDETKVGPLYLGCNDLPEMMSKVDGQIEVELQIAL